MSEYIIFFQSGDRRNKKVNPRVRIVMHDEFGGSSNAIFLRDFFQMNTRHGSLDTFAIALNLCRNMDRSAKVDRIEFWAEDDTVNGDWLINKIVIENRTTIKAYVFPMYQWIRRGVRYNVVAYNTVLPQYDEFAASRQAELEEKKKLYQLEQHIPGGPVQAKFLPSDEDYSFKERWSIDELLAWQEKTTDVPLRTSGDFRSFADMQNFSFYSTRLFPKPSVLIRNPTSDCWNDDAHFGLQRILGLNHSLIARVKQIPAKFPVRIGMVNRFMEGLSIREAITQNKLFIVDFALLDGVPTRKDFKLCAPIGLFYYTTYKCLKPIAIQLYQRPGPNNPIFTPACHPMTWAAVKMWFNNADAAYHQSLCHLGYTHIMIEGIALSVHRNLSASHPIFRLLGPHINYIIGINNQVLGSLMSPDGFVDRYTNIGVEGMNEIIRKGFNKWRMDVEGMLEKSMQDRGLDDPTVLPTYYYRHDGMILWSAFMLYVANYLALYYRNVAVIKEDYELQNWAKELVKDRNKSRGGLGLKGIPGDGEITKMRQLVDICASIIYICTALHSSVSNAQFDQYGFAPCYPILMKGSPPTDKDARMTEQEVLRCLPNREEQLAIMRMTKLLSCRGTKPLGEFEWPYIFEYDAIKVCNLWRITVAEVGRTITRANDLRNNRYYPLDPAQVSNYIHI